MVGVAVVVGCRSCIRDVPSMPLWDTKRRDSPYRCFESSRYEGISLPHATSSPLQEALLPSPPALLLLLLPLLDVVVVVVVGVAIVADSVGRREIVVVGVVGC